MIPQSAFGSVLATQKLPRNYRLVIYRDGVTETVEDEYGDRHAANKRQQYGVINPDGVRIGPHHTTYADAMSFCQRLRRVTPGRDY